MRAARILERYGMPVLQDIPELPAPDGTTGAAAGKIIVKVNRDWPAKFSTIDRSARACARCSIGIEPVEVGADFHELTVALFKRE